MPFLSFESQPLWVNIAIFLVAAGVVWLAGTRLAGYVNTIAERAGLGKAFVGLVLLGGITSLPEVATSATASIGGNASLAVNNLLGGVAMQVVILAVADAAIGRAALTSIVTESSVLLQGMLSILLLVLVIAGITVGEVSVFGVGLWATAILALYILAVWLIGTYGGERRQSEAGNNPDEGDAPSLEDAVLKTAAAGLAILVAGFLLARTGEAIAAQTGLGASFVGAVFVGVSTSLPEVSSVLSAVRLKQHEMAISDVFGANLFDVALIFLVDVLYMGKPVLEEVGRFSSFTAVLGIAVTAMYVAGLSERRDRTVLSMGVDSVAVLGTYVGGLVILYYLR